MALGISSRPGPDNPTGPSSTQVSYGPNRTVDANYYSFAYTRLQEQDWAEVFIHARKKHVDAAVGWMGYWFQSVGFRNHDAAWAPGMAYVALDTDFELSDAETEHCGHGGRLVAELWVLREVRHLHPRAFSPTGRASCKLTVPFTPDLDVDGHGRVSAPAGTAASTLALPPFTAAITGVDLIA